MHKSLKDCQRILETKVDCKQCGMLRKEVAEVRGSLAPFSLVYGE